MGGPCSTKMAKGVLDIICMWQTSFLKPVFPNFLSDTVIQGNKMYEKFMMAVGLLTPFLNLPHIFKMIEIQSSAGQSVFSIAAFIVSFILFLLYGIKRKDKVIVVTYSAAIVITIVYLITIVHYAV